MIKLHKSLIGRAKRLVKPHKWMRVVGNGKDPANWFVQIHPWYLRWLIVCAVASHIRLHIRVRKAK